MVEHRHAFDADAARGDTAVALSGSRNVPSAAYRAAGHVGELREAYIG